MQREITQELVKQLLPERRADSNKGSYGSSCFTSSCVISRCVLAAAGSMAVMLPTDIFADLGELLAEMKM